MMASRDPNKLYPFNPSIDSMKDALTRSELKPYIGVTQGGSSRGKGAKVAAHSGEKPAARIYTQE
jgi:hypothetical protein